MCFIYNHKCRVCDAPVRMHIRDYDWEPKNLYVYCPKHWRVPVLTRAKYYGVYRVGTDERISVEFLGTVTAESPLYSVHPADVFDTVRVHRVADRSAKPKRWRI